MSCLTPEQLAAIALGLDDAERPAHVDECPPARQQLADLRRLTDDLATAHADLNRHHATSRAELLSRLPHLDRAVHTATRWKRFTFGGLGLSAAAALLLLAFFATSSNQLSAMERIVKAAPRRHFVQLQAHESSRAPRDNGETGEDNRPHEFHLLAGTLQIETGPIRRPARHAEECGRLSLADR